MFAQLVLSGLSNGSIYALAALGMTVLFRATTVVHFGFGEMFMAGAFVVYVLLKLVGLPYAVAAVLACVLLFLIGGLIEFGLMRRMRHAPHLSLAMMTIAVSFLLKGIARIFWGRDVLPMPPIFDFDPIIIGNVILTAQDAVIGGATLGLVAVFLLVFRYSWLGKIAQAASLSPRGAALVGLNVPRFHWMMWGVTAMMGAIGGILVAPVTLLYPDMGAQTLTRAFAAMTLGGFGNLGGAVVGGLAVGVIEQLAGGYVATSLIDVAGYVVIIAVLLLRPNGIFGRQDVVRV
ncbi:MAG: branched-chain amino acid ABC transporter permease [Acetobacteraceae bacterium]